MTQEPDPLSTETTPHELRNSEFASALLDPDTQMPSGVGKQGHSAPKRFSVYRNNVVVSLMEAMKAAYPSLHKIMGEENFALVSRNFIANHPPKSPLMLQYGREFPQFLSAFRPLAKSPFLKDVATAELKWLEAYHALDGAFIEPADLTEIDPEKTMDLKFRAHPAASIIQSEFPVFDLFNARITWPCPGINLQNSQTMLISRPVYDCLATLLTPSQAVFFNALLDGKTLGEAIAIALQNDATFDASQAISILLQTGIFKKPF
ncbi:MAG: DNA-binding domain-containing protein [Salaquimonas sp.]